LVELVHQAYVIAGRKAVTIVDVGAASWGHQYFCVSAIARGWSRSTYVLTVMLSFFDYLRENLGGREDVALVYALSLSDLGF
jgi:hypothetical protein